MLAAVGVLAAAILIVAARPAAVCADIAPLQESIEINAGESKIIDHLNPHFTPSIRVIENAHALVVHGEVPGQVELMGAERGRWEVTVTRDDGVKVVYLVTVTAVADSAHPLNPGTAPAALSDNGAMPAMDAVTAETGASSAAAASSLGASSVPGARPEVIAEGANPVRPSARYSDPYARAPSLGQQASVGGVRVSTRPVHNDPAIADTDRRYLSPSVSGGPNYMPLEGISMMTGTSQIIDFPHRMKRISIADSSIADVQVTSPYQLNVIGHKPGFTTLAVWDEQGRYDEREVRIDASGKQQVMLNVLVSELNLTNLENQGINLSIALPKYGISAVGLPGAVATPFSAQNASSTGGSASLPSGGGIIPLLLSQSLTYGLAAQNSNILTQSFFQFLEQHNMARILAEPHLLANSGEEAKFLSGGEIPIVIAQALNTSIVFKQFGTSVTFVPTVVGSRDIELLVKTEVSQPDFAHGVQLFGFQVPAFITRRAETMVRLKDSQTLIMAGLIIRDKRAVVEKVPYLGDIPYAGGLFRNTQWQESVTDLVMAVTPQIVRPLFAQGQVFVPSNRGPLNPQEIRTEPLAQPDAARPRF